jgi:hypothetical protein
MSKPISFARWERSVPGMSFDAAEFRSAAQTLLRAIDAGAVGQDRDGARVHPFPARMPQSLARAIIEALSRPGDVVLDPMCGSGTTVVAAKFLGRVGVGIDRDPLALLVSRVSVNDHWPDDILLAGKRILTRAKQVMKEEVPRLKSGKGRHPAELRTFLSYWFPRGARDELDALRIAIREEPADAVRTLSEVAFSSLIIAKSAGVSYALDIARSRPHKVKGRELSTPFALWEKRFTAVIARRSFAAPAGLPAMVMQGDARNLPIASGRVDLVLTSPPCLNAIDYLRGHRFSLVWMGHSLKGLRELRGSLIGSERGLWTRDGLPTELELRLKRRLEEGRRQALVRRYLSDLGHSLSEVSRVLRSGGLAAMVLGPTVINKSRSDEAEVVEALGVQHGLTMVGHAVRSLPAGWRSLPPPGKLARSNPVAGRMRREVVVIFQKP